MSRRRGIQLLVMALFVLTLGLLIGGALRMGSEAQEWPAMDPPPAVDLAPLDIDDHDPAEPDRAALPWPSAAPQRRPRKPGQRRLSPVTREIIRRLRAEAYPNARRGVFVSIGFECLACRYSWDRRVRLMPDRTLVIGPKDLHCEHCDTPEGAAAREVRL